MRAPTVAIEATIRILRSTDLNAPSNVVLTVRPTTGTGLGVLYLALVCFGIAGYQLFQNQAKSGLLFLAFGCFAGGLPLLNIRSLINTYQTKVANTQDRVTSTTNTILTWLLITAIALTILCIIVAAALLLLFLVCLQFILHGRFPSLRVTYD